MGKKGQNVFDGPKNFFRGENVGVREGLSGLCPKSLISLCNLCVLCVSVVDEFRGKIHHRDTENTEVAQRRSPIRTFRARPSLALNKDLSPKS
jgi:hypothetical protein